MTTAPKPPLPVSLLWAVPERAGDIAAIHGTLFPEAWDGLAVARLLERPGATSLVAEAGTPRAVVGFVIGQVAADEAEIITLGVALPWQRKGIGRMLVDGVARAAKRAEARRLFLEVAADNPAAFALYGRAGFTEVGRRKGYYARRAPAPPVDAVVMSLAL